ncbi:MAG: GNAT family N-acetyltransferase [Candidatus Lokiarchaeota archaeon]|nr:GNAT family N-acetyltransferase [Candidatus Harpocratesius repetitus]
MVEFPILFTERLKLRKPQKDDEQIQKEILQDKEIMRYIGMEPFKTIDDVRNEMKWFIDLVEKGEGIRWIIALKETNECIGDIGFHRLDKRHFKCEIGYKLKRSFWGKGYMTEAGKSALNYAFDKLNVNRIEGLVDPRNLPSIRLLERLGFKKEGILRDYEFERGEFVNLQISSILKREWEKMKNDN